MRRRDISSALPRPRGNQPPRADSVDTAGATVPELHGRDRPKAKREQPTSPHRRGSTRRGTRPGANMDRSATPHERGSTEQGSTQYSATPRTRGLTARRPDEKGVASPPNAGINHGVPPHEDGSRRIPRKLGDGPHPSHTARRSNLPVPRQDGDRPRSHQR